MRCCKFCDDGHVDGLLSERCVVFFLRFGNRDKRMEGERKLWLRDAMIVDMNDEDTENIIFTYDYRRSNGATSHATQRTRNFCYNRIELVVSD